MSSHVAASKHARLIDSEGELDTELGAVRMDELGALQR